VRASLASEPGDPGKPNDDWAAASTIGVAVLLDGLSEGSSSGCRHGTGWYVRQLGRRLLSGAEDRATALDDVLARSIDEVAALHRGDCALDHPGSPAATVAVVRQRGPGLDFLVLADTVVVFDTGAYPLVVTDQRVRGYLPAGDDLTTVVDAQQRSRNTADGYWVAQTDPAAAGQALTGTVADTPGALLLSDGAALAVTDFGALSWRELLDLGFGPGPAELIAVTRELAARDPQRVVWPRLKLHDDATAVACHW
jgi:hypothetical protein